MKVIDVMNKIQDVDFAIKQIEASNLTETDRKDIIQFLKDYKQRLESIEVKWLNHEFYHDAFTPDEKKKILTTKLRNAKNPLYETEGGDDTEDKIFLLSINEANEYFSSDEERQAFFPDGNPVKGWWLRSLGYTNTLATLVDYDGFINQIGLFIDDVIVVRPALWVDF